jgi:DNA-binding MarR family transcriptional regulator
MTDPFEGLLGYHLRRLSVIAMADLAAALAPLDLKPTEASMLFVIDASPGISQSEVGRILGVKRANMAPLVASLMRRGLIEREPVDGRLQALRLSCEGESMRAKARACVETHEERVFGSLSKDVRNQMIAVLASLWSKPEAEMEVE